MLLTLHQQPVPVCTRCVDVGIAHTSALLLACLQVMVLFCDVVGFTSMSKEVEPSEVMHFLNELYESFDKLVDEYDMYKLGT